MSITKNHEFHCHSIGQPSSLGVGERETRSKGDGGGGG